MLVRYFVIGLPTRITTPDGEPNHFDQWEMIAECSDEAEQNRICLSWSQDCGLEALAAISRDEDGNLIPRICVGIYHVMSFYGLPGRFKMDELITQLHTAIVGQPAPMPWMRDHVDNRGE